MTMARPTILSALLLTAVLSGCGGGTDGNQADAGTEIAIDGQLNAGLRTLTFDPAAGTQDVTIYRGDYIVPVLVSGDGFTITIADLGVDRTYPVPEGEKARIKVPNAGSFAYAIGNLTGTITAVEYASAAYREVNAAEAAAFIANREPLILDVRTAGEFAEGHIKGAVVVPVQVLQQRVAELADHKDDPVFVYCRSGNRSTVAAKVLIDAGFKQIVNLRHGVKDWSRAGQPLVR